MNVLSSSCILLFVVKYIQQSFPYENHCKCYKKLTSRLWHVLFTGFPLMGGTGGIPPTTWKNGLSPHFRPTVLTPKCWFCHFHAVFDHFAQIVPPPVDPIWETLIYTYQLFSFALTHLFCWKIVFQDNSSLVLKALSFQSF